MHVDGERTTGDFRSPLGNRIFGVDEDVSLDRIYQRGFVMRSARTLPYDSSDHVAIHAVLERETSPIQLVSVLAHGDTIVSQLGDEDFFGFGLAVGSVGDPVPAFDFDLAVAAGPAPGCAAACDVNGDGEVGGSAADTVYLVVFAFGGGASLPPPFPACGPARFVSDRTLGCDVAGGGCR